MVGSRFKYKMSTSISKIEKMKFHGSPIAFKPSHTACTGASNCGEAEFGEVGGALRGAGEDSLEQQSSALALAQMLFLAQMRAKKVSQLRNCVLHHEGLYDGRLHFDFLAEDLTLCFFWEQLQFIASCPTCTIPLAQNMSLQDHTFFAHSLLGFSARDGVMQ